MITGIMQPYLFPYLGYFQLINAVDVFVIRDDVQYIRKGWINRNRILVHDQPAMFTFPVKKDSRTADINTRNYESARFDSIRKRFLATVYSTYKKSPNFSDIYQLVSEIIAYPNRNVSVFNTHSIEYLCDYLGIDTEIVISSHLEKKNDLKSYEAVIEINRVLNSDHYINPIGGSKLYSKDLFRDRGMKISFIEMDPIEYAQFGATFVPSLSIIDVLMFNSPEKVREFLDCYTLV